MASSAVDGASAEEAVPGAPNEIGDHEFVLRKVPAVPHLQPAGEGKRRISKSAFSASSVSVDSEEGMSVNSQSILEAHGVQPQDFAPEFPVLARFCVGDLRALGLTVEPRPIPGDDSHCQVLGVRDKHRKKLLQLAEFIRKPPDVE